MDSTTAAADACAELNALAEARGWPMRGSRGDAFEREELRALYDLWLSKTSHGIPSRTAFDMRTLRPFARNITILERTQTGSRKRYRFRLFGSTLALLFGEHTGRHLDEMVTPALLPSWRAFYDAVLASDRPMRISNYYRTPDENYLMGEILAAPMADESGDVRFILAATYVGLEDGVKSPFAEPEP